MSGATHWDHLFLVIVLVVYPFIAWRTFPGLVARVRARGETAKIAGYRETIALWLGFAAMLVLMWILLDREWADLGFRWPGLWRLGVGTAAGVGLLWLTDLQLRKLTTGGPDGRSASLEQIGGDVLVFLPTSRRELAWFRAVSINAGVTEELVYRGFLLWYLEPFVGTVAAGLLAIAAFTLGHLYQGLANLPGIAFVSAFFVVLYLSTGSLLLPVVFHALLDIVQGNALARRPRASSQTSPNRT